MTTSSRAYAVAILVVATGLAAAAAPAMAMDWSDNAVSVRYGTQFAEPYNNRKIDKTIAAFTHASGYAYGSNFLNVDALFSDRKDPRTPAPALAPRRCIWSIGTRSTSARSAASTWNSARCAISA